MIYSIMSGQLSLDNGILVGTGYSGYGIYKNNPNACNLISRGPIPRGKYTMVNVPDNKHLGTYLIKLIPFKENIMFGRSGFYIHGEDGNPLTEDSEGCIIMSHNVRLFLQATKDRVLTVIS